MTSSYDLTNKRQEYYNLLDNVHAMTESLNRACNEMEESCDIEQYFSIDGESVDNNRISNTYREMCEDRDKLNDEVIPAINDTISSLGTQITRAQEEEERERQRQEEEERRRREASNR